MTRRSRCRLQYKTSTDPVRIRIATVIQQQLADVGIDLQLLSYDWGTFYGDIKAGRFQMYSLAWVGIKTPDIFRYAFYSDSLPPEGANRGRLADARVDQLIEAAEQAATLDIARCRVTARCRPACWNCCRMYRSGTKIMSSPCVTRSAVTGWHSMAITMGCSMCSGGIKERGITRHLRLTQCCNSFNFSRIRRFPAQYLLAGKHCRYQVPATTQFGDHHRDDMDHREDQQRIEAVVVRGDEGFAEGAHRIPGILVNHLLGIGHQRCRLDTRCGDPAGDPGADRRIEQVRTRQHQSADGLCQQQEQQECDCETAEGIVPEVLARLRAAEISNISAHSV